ncbi:hypothetical protein MAMP_00164 [Methylophaga aminisulfidivorans MP]|uniref:Uncharacterized protein n=1 Tax=Methylophaga aminisulfidivorans MP TaxID=1026882 RepID=F5T0S3_9GAMM|nr:hypothetical protein MAMP_00164 [Methylophaga aminisulfidivorans MP]
MTKADNPTMAYWSAKLPLGSLILDRDKTASLNLEPAT